MNAGAEHDDRAADADRDLRLARREADQQGQAEAQPHDDDPQR